jgi:hypothetical protein
VDEVARTRVEPERTRPLTTIFGEVAVERLAYRARGVPNLYPADAMPNLPAEKHSHGLRRLAAIESTRGSFDEVDAFPGQPGGFGFPRWRKASRSARAIRLPRAPGGGS